MDVVKFGKGDGEGNFPAIFNEKYYSKSNVPAVVLANKGSKKTTAYTLNEPLNYRPVQFRECLLHLR